MVSLDNAFFRLSQVLEEERGCQAFSVIISFRTVFAVTQFVIASLKCHLIQPVRNVNLRDVKREKVVYVRGKQA